MDIRKQILVQRKQLNRVDVLQKSHAICNQLLQSYWLDNVKVVLSYLPYGNEVSLLDLNKYFKQKEITVLVPVCRKGQKGIMDAVFFDIDKPDDLVQNSLGVWEPRNSIVFEPDKIDLVLVPGVVFDKFGNRMGHGMGYYDRYLTKLRDDAKTIGIGYEMQLVESLKVQPWDFKLDALCTEKNFYMFI